MDNQFSGGSWSTMPNIPTHTNTPTPPSQDHLFLQQQQQQFQQHHQQQQQQFQQQQQQQQQQFQQQQQQTQSHPHHQLQQQIQPHQPRHQPTSLASHFHLLPLVESLAHAIETGNRDPQSDALVNELNNHFEKCQQLLNSISVSISKKAVTVEGQKHKLEESEQLLIQRKDLIEKYRSSVEELIKPNP